MTTQVELSKEEKSKIMKDYPVGVYSLQSEFTWSKPDKRVKNDWRRSPKAIPAGTKFHLTVREPDEDLMKLVEKNTGKKAYPNEFRTFRLNKAASQWSCDYIDSTEPEFWELIVQLTSDDETLGSVLTGTHNFEVKMILVQLMENGTISLDDIKEARENYVALGEEGINALETKHKL